MRCLMPYNDWLSQYTGSRGKVEMNELVKKNEDLLEEIVNCEKDTM